MQRIRLQSFAPLPSFRVWYLVPQNVVDVQSLKRSLSAQLPAFKDSDIRPAQLVLEIDDFELLDNTSIDLVHEGDIVSVKLREPTDWLKRKADVEKDGKTLKRRRVSVSSEDSSSVSSSSTSNSSSDSSSSNSGSTSSASDSDSTESRPSSIRKTPLSSTKKVQAKSSPAIQSRTASHVRTANHQPTVPPGLGMPSTHSRNQRRRQKRKRKPASLLQKDNSVQLTVDRLLSSTRSNGVLKSSLQPSEQMPLPATVSVTSGPSIRTHTKGKRSSKSMETPGAQGVIDSSSAATSSGYPPKFIPPSEREDLPKNMFVTSVEVDWRTDRGATSQKHENVHLEAEVQDADSAVEVLDPDPRHSIDWADIEKTWDKHKTLESSTKLLPDSIVAWKAFDIDPVTLTPQASMIHLAKVISVDEEHVHIQPLTRPNIGCASFGRASIGEDDELAEQVSQPLKEIWCNDWKLIPGQ